MHECVANMGAVTHNIMPKQNAVLFVPEVFLLGHSACVCPVARAVLRSGLLTYTHDTSIYDRSLAHKYWSCSNNVGSAAGVYLLMLYSKLLWWWTIIILLFNVESIAPSIYARTIRIPGNFPSMFQYVYISIWLNIDANLFPSHSVNICLELSLFYSANSKQWMAFNFILQCCARVFWTV